MDAPLVTVICTCYNQGEFVYEALDSVLHQSHPSIELIIIDNGSLDHSVQVIHNWVDLNKSKKYCTAVFHPETINYCKSFNQALKLAKGKYIIDLSGDDLLLPDHVTTAVEALEVGNAAVYFSNAYIKDEKNGSLKTFYPVDNEGKLMKEVDSGDIYINVVQKNFLSAPTMVIRTEILLNEGGYDEELSYEDFDVIVRLARKYKFVFNEYLGVKKRLLKNSFAAKQYSIKNSIMLPSTLRVCRKIMMMNQTPKENFALRFRILFETKHALASANFQIVSGFLNLAEELGVSGTTYKFFRLWEKYRWDLSYIYKLIKF